MGPPPKPVSGDFEQLPCLSAEEADEMIDRITHSGWHITEQQIMLQVVALCRNIGRRFQSVAAHIAKRVGKSERTVRRVLNKMRDQGHLKEYEIWKRYYDDNPPHYFDAAAGTWLQADEGWRCIGTVWELDVEEFSQVSDIYVRQVVGELADMNRSDLDLSLSVIGQKPHGMGEEPVVVRGTPPFVQACGLSDGPSPRADDMAPPPSCAPTAQGHDSSIKSFQSVQEEPVISVDALSSKQFFAEIFESARTFIEGDQEQAQLLTDRVEGLPSYHPSAKAYWAGAGMAFDLKDSPDPMGELRQAYEYNLRLVDAEEQERLRAIAKAQEKRRRKKLKRLQR